jgi:hypothetical protein
LSVVRLPLIVVARAPTVATAKIAIAVRAEITFIQKPHLVPAQSVRAIYSPSTAAR